MKRTEFARDYVCMVAWLLVSVQGCIADGSSMSSHVDEEELDASVEYVEEKAGEAQLSTEELVGRVAAMPDKTLVVFDFDDTLRDHVQGQSSRWATYAKSAVTQLKQNRIAISVCSRNDDADALKKALRSLDSSVFNDAFFRSPAFQADTGLDKSDDIRQAMSYFGIQRDKQVVFYDDNQGNIDRVNAGTDVISIMVHSNGLDRDEFRGGMIQRLNGSGGGSTGGGTTGSCAGKCSSSCRCTAGQGDCDSNADCASGLVCPPDRDGAEQCRKP